MLRPLFASLALAATYLACGGDTESGKKDAGGEGEVDAVSDGDAVEPASDGGAHDGGCANVLPDGAQACVLCDGDWYCPNNRPLPACPFDGEEPPGGACSSGGGLCFTCVQETYGETCDCDVDGGDDAAEDGSGPAWNCTPAGIGC